MTFTRLNSLRSPPAISLVKVGPSLDLVVVNRCSGKLGADRIRRLIGIQLCIRLCYCRQLIIRSFTNKELRERERKNERERGAKEKERERDRDCERLKGKERGIEYHIFTFPSFLVRLDTAAVLPDTHTRRKCQESVNINNM